MFEPLEDETLFKRLEPLTQAVCILTMLGVIESLKEICPSLECERKTGIGDAAKLCLAGAERSWRIGIVSLVLDLIQILQCSGVVAGGTHGRKGTLSPVVCRTPEMGKSLVAVVGGGVGTGPLSLGSENIRAEMGGVPGGLSADMEGWLYPQS